MQHHFEKQAYLPTVEEIRQACQEIQRGWTPEEREKRTRFRPRTPENGLDVFIDAMRLMRTRELRQDATV